MSFASHELPDDPLLDAVAPVPAAPVCPFSRGAKPAKKAGLAMKLARYGIFGTSAVLVLCAVKCIVLYMVVPALAVGYFASGPSQSSIKESSHDSQVPASCPITGKRLEPTVNAHERADDSASVDLAENTDAAAAR